MRQLAVPQRRDGLKKHFAAKREYLITMEITKEQAVKELEKMSAMLCKISGCKWGRSAEQAMHCVQDTVFQIENSTEG